MSALGNSIKRRGKAKYLGGVGRKITGITRRRFHANLQRIRVTLPSGAPARIRVCAQCLRSGRVQKRVKRIIPQPQQSQ
jgi:large subunit ribosomal protein L28